MKHEHSRSGIRCRSGRWLIQFSCESLRFSVAVGKIVAYGFNTDGSPRSLDSVRNNHTREDRDCKTNKHNER